MAAFLVLCVSLFLNASFWMKTQKQDASFQIRRKTGFTDYIFQYNR